jgi:hypothetical protein
VHPPGQVAGRAVKALYSVAQDQIKVVKQSKTQPSCGPGSNTSQDAASQAPMTLLSALPQE